MGSKARAGDGVVAGAGCIDGRHVFCYAQDQSYAGGSLGEAHANTVTRILRLAGQAAAPVVSFIESGGARMQEGLAALAGYARIFRENVALSGRVPQISVITGTSAGGGSYSPALTDFVLMTEDASMFLTGPGVVRAVLGEDTSADQLGGPRVHERNGVCHLVVADVADAIVTVRKLLGYLPQNSSERPDRHAVYESPTRRIAGIVPTESSRVYDVRHVLDAIADADTVLEIAPRFARSIVCAFARVEGCSVGVVANQPRYVGGVIDADASQKAARFVRTCNSFGVPLVVLVDTPGFMPGRAQETAGIIRHGAQLLHAFAEATVPRITVVLRKAYGGAYITMNSKDLGAHLTFAWPNAELGVMAARQAVEIIHRRDIASAPDPTEAGRELAATYADQHLRATVAAREGVVDEIIDPSDTRARIAWGLESLSGSRGDLGLSHPLLPL